MKTTDGIICLNSSELMEAILCEVNEQSNIYYPNIYSALDVQNFYSGALASLSRELNRKKFREVLTSLEVILHVEGLFELDVCISERFSSMEYNDSNKGYVMNRAFIYALEDMNKNFKYN